MKVGQIIAVGGGVKMLGPLFEANLRRQSKGLPNLYLLPSHPEIENFTQLINAFAMQNYIEAAE